MDYFLPLKSALEKNGSFNIPKVEKAFHFADSAHKEAGQTRKTEEPYIIHPVAVAEILLELGADEETLIASLLHDTVENTAVVLSDIEEHFGKEVAFLVDGVTNAEKDFKEMSKSDHKKKIIHKLFSYIAKDPRIILIKLSDRLHNVRTLMAMKPEKRMKKAQETLDFYVPLAQVGNLWSIKRELEDICFQVMSPEEYELLTRKILQEKKLQKKNLSNLQKIIQERIKIRNEEGSIFVEDFLPFELKKYLFQKNRKNQHFFQVRICTKNREEVYRTLGTINELFHCAQGSIKDYVSAPKKNGYEALHTTVTIEGKRCLFILQDEVHCEAGKEQCTFFSSRADTKESLMNVLPEIIERSRSTESFLFNLKNHALADTVSIHDNKGNTYRIPKGSSLLDAYFLDKPYSSHEEEIPQYAFLNGEKVLLRVALQENDVFDFSHSSEKMKVSPILLRYVKTTDAHFFLMNCFRQNSDEKARELGREWLLDEFARMGIVPKLKSEKDALSCVDDTLPFGRGKKRSEEILSSVLQEICLEHPQDQVNVKVYNGKSRVGFVQSLLEILKEKSFNMTEIKGSTPDGKNSLGVVEFKIEIFDIKKENLFLVLASLANALEQVDGVEKVVFGI